MCSRVTVLKGVKIGNDCVVAHSSVCTKAFSGDRQLIAGYPAKVIRENVSWKNSELVADRWVDLKCITYIKKTRCGE